MPIVDYLEPRFDLLKQQWLLVQAWKKTASYIRNHNWFADTLELDHATVNLPDFLQDIANQLESPADWSTEPIRIIPAPKSQRWHVDNTKDSGRRWQPIEKRKTTAPIRPLAYVTLRDQVVATAIMLCLADRVETLQGDPEVALDVAAARKHTISYGNRLFCDVDEGRLHHRWGSSKLYRSYYQDYRHFLERPETVAAEVKRKSENRIAVVHSDLRQFYDRVTPGLLAQKVGALQTQADDPQFFEFANRALAWKWANGDRQEIKQYQMQTGLSDFSTVSLPQGLVSAGFFANIALLDFDRSLNEAIGREIFDGVVLRDVCRYVDDLRIVLEARTEAKPEVIKVNTFSWLNGILESEAAGCEASEPKTTISEYGSDRSSLVPQHRKMHRIQTAISGGFDAIGGEAILDSILGLIRTQQRYSKDRLSEENWAFAPVPDVRDDTVARFAAGRFRRTYRSLRPMLPTNQEFIDEHPTSKRENRSSSLLRQTKESLDDETRAFALGLIENWVNDPSNVRLLRIGLDLWPTPEVLNGVLSLLRPYTQKNGGKGSPRRIAWYCLSEIFRAGATETGIVEDDEALPQEVDLIGYRAALIQEAVRVAFEKEATIPWYLRQQALLLISAVDPTQGPQVHVRSSRALRRYQQLLKFLRNDHSGFSLKDYATFAVLARRSFGSSSRGLDASYDQLSIGSLEAIAERDPGFFAEIFARNRTDGSKLRPRLRDDLALQEREVQDGWLNLSSFVLGGQPDDGLRNEISLLRFSIKFLEQLSKLGPDAATLAIVPTDVQLNVAGEVVSAVLIHKSAVKSDGSMYQPPTWCSPQASWRFQLGFLLRFILVADRDFTAIVKLAEWKESKPIYRIPRSHWYQRTYGFFNGILGLGGAWLPISDWVESLITSLLRWPGCAQGGEEFGVGRGIEATVETIQLRLNQLETGRKKSGVQVLPLKAPRPDGHSIERPLRGCVIQTVIPYKFDDLGDLMCSKPAMRRQHANHLSTALAAVERMLALRETHLDRGGRLDWLILPELSVHPVDVQRHLVPFARKYKTIVLAGQTYSNILAGRPLFNTAVWIVPTWSAARGLQVTTRIQGKKHLAPNEQQINGGSNLIQGFRPCQWKIGYEWSGNAEPLWLTGSICYDATDLSLAAGLRHETDVFAIPALNRDVSTFDNMAMALHYHMFQYVIVANNGRYGGSNAYAPYKLSFKRQVFHLHGQPQASAAFFEIDNIAAYQARKELSAGTADPDSLTSEDSWKNPPAGL